MRNLHKALAGLLMGVSIFASQACCEEHNMQMSDKARDVIANPKGTLQSRGVVSLQDYVVEEQEMYNWLFKNHPIFTKYGGTTADWSGLPKDMALICQSLVKEMVVRAIVL